VEEIYGLRFSLQMAQKRTKSLMMFVRIKKSLFVRAFLFLLICGGEGIALSGDSSELKDSLFGRKNLDQLLAHWPPQFPFMKSSPISVKAWEIPSDGDYIGLEKQMTIQAPLEKVDRLLGDFEHYIELFPEFKEIRVLKREALEILTRWERGIPFPFVPDVYYVTAYQVDRSKAGRVVLRAQVKESNRVRVSDDLVVLEKKGPSETLWSGFSFFEVDWGPVRILGAGKIWKDSIEGSVLSDLSFKLRAEHPDWSADKIHSERPKMLPDHLVDDTYEQRQTFDLGELIPALKVAPSPTASGGSSSSNSSPTRLASPSPSFSVSPRPSPLTLTE
jgi:hypothetical protein